MGAQRSSTTNRFPGSVSGRIPHTTALLVEQEELIKEASRARGILGESVGMLLRRFALERAEQIVDIERAHAAVMSKEGVQDTRCAVCGGCGKKLAMDAGVAGYSDCETCGGTGHLRASVPVDKALDNGSNS